LTLDRNSDGALSSREYRGLGRLVRDADQNNDGRINRSEIRYGCEAGILKERDISG
jgi:hypothetical protein